jgi:hypothetical protein
MERLRLLWKFSGCYEESVGAMEVIVRQEKSVDDMEVTGCHAKPAVTMER